jgi:glycosyltransferase involved in cell wall biosynthesis
VWVGRIVPLKRLEWLLDIAEAMRDVCFDVVGPPDPETDYTRALLERARTLPNVVLHGRIDRPGMSEVYRPAACLCCTSAYEGFPNTFVEAWSHGVPAVSTFDPDDLISNRGLGAVAQDVSGLVTALRSLLGSPLRWRQASENARQYYQENHTVQEVMPRFEQFFLEARDLRCVARRGWHQSTGE